MRERNQAALSHKRDEPAASRSETGARSGIVAVALIFLAACSGEPKPGASASPENSLNGRELAAAACMRCHDLPSPAQLSPEDWPYLLAWMGNYLGFREESQIDSRLIDRKAVPAAPVISKEQFEAIRSYYMAGSAIQYEFPKPTPPPSVSTLFEPVLLDVPPSVITMVAIDPVDRMLIIGSSRPAALLFVRNGTIESVEVNSEPVTFERVGASRRIALMGHIGYDAGIGSVLDFAAPGNQRSLIVSGHPRIADHATADVDGDGTDDLLVCGFGDYSAGRVGIWWGGGGKWTEQVLTQEGGAVWCGIADLDGDGDRDIVLALANGRPRLLAFVNDGSRKLTARVIVERPVGWGYNRCLLVDWDGDGRPDIVELAGNNLELRGRPLKAHHGIRVLHNDGNWQFRETLFERLQGAIDVVAGDFDRNGRVDLAVTAFYPDWRPEFPTTFLLLLQRPDGSVERAGIADRLWQRWMRIGVGDADGDGDLDLLLGAAVAQNGVPARHTEQYQKLVSGKSSVLLLRNQSVP